MPLRDVAARWLAEGRAAVVVEVVAARGSVPRGVGTRMLVAGDAVAGTIGGGHLELKAIAEARGVLGWACGQGFDTSARTGGGSELASGLGFDTSARTGGGGGSGGAHASGRDFDTSARTGGGDGSDGTHASAPGSDTLARTGSWEPEREDGERTWRAPVRPEVSKDPAPAAPDAPHPPFGLRYRSPRHERHYPLGPALGQCCGGAVTLAFTPLDATLLAAWPTTAPRFHLQLYGAGHVGRAIARLLSTLDVSVDWIDERDDEFPAALLDGAWPAHIRRIAVDGVEHEVHLAPPGAFFLVLTHRHDLDERITEAILRRGDFGFLGLIGSKTKRQKFIHRFEALGIAPDAIARMTCPIGIAGIAGKEPEVIAVAVVAQLLAASR